MIFSNLEHHLLMSTCCRAPAVQHILLPSLTESFPWKVPTVRDHWAKKKKNLNQTQNLIQPGQSLAEAAPLQAALPEGKLQMLISVPNTVLHIAHGWNVILKLMKVDCRLSQTASSASQDN